jgi:hypothetical protein
MERSNVYITIAARGSCHLSRSDIFVACGQFEGNNIQGPKRGTAKKSDWGSNNLDTIISES